MRYRIELSMIWLTVLIGVFLAQFANGQSPSPSPSPSPSVSASVSATPIPSRAAQKSSPAATLTPAATSSPSTSDLISSLSAADVQAAIGLVKANFTNPEAINEAQINRATLQGLVTRLNNGVLLLPGAGGTPPAETPAPLYSEILEGHIGYLRPGTFSSANLQMFDKKMAEFAQKKVDALVLDLRISSSSDFGVAADFSKRFVPNGKTLFAMRRQGKQDKTFTSDRDPIYRGLMMLLTDSDTSGGAEAFAAALRFYDKALVIGQSTAGRAVEYSDLKLPSGRLLRVAVAECTGPDGKSLYPEGTKPDVPVEMSLVDKRQIFSASASKGMAPFVQEVERPHMNEAALIAGTNPELETAEQRRGRTQANQMHDLILQRALDLVTSLEIYQKR